METNLAPGLYIKHNICSCNFRQVAQLKEDLLKNLMVKGPFFQDGPISADLLTKVLQAVPISLIFSMILQCVRTKGVFN